MVGKFTFIGLAVAALGVVSAPAAGGSLGAPDPDPGTASAGPSWSDEFEGRAGLPPNARRWTYDTGATGWGNGELQRYTSSRANSHLDGRGNLVIVARHLQGSGRERGSYTSARLTTSGRFSFRYGRVAVRARLPRGQGLWPAFWMLGTRFPELDWPFCGEIDVMEYLGHQPRISYGYVHGPGSMAEIGVGGENRSDRPLPDGFHVFSARWSPSQVSFSVDGRVFRTVERASYPAGQTWAFDREMFLLLNLAVGGGWPGKPDATTRFPARMKVDWVRVWEAGSQAPVGGDRPEP
ncbi:MAG: glycoside hydrolase family 16 protein [Solirubrobacterales bacterium]|nr:glycoside hydrolase family 16 protein [Solirubrobacterales bacterium]